MKLLNFFRTLQTFPRYARAAGDWFRREMWGTEVEVWPASEPRLRVTLLHSGADFYLVEFETLHPASGEPVHRVAAVRRLGTDADKQCYYVRVRVLKMHEGRGEGIASRVPEVELLDSTTRLTYRVPATEVWI